MGRPAAPKASPVDAHAGLALLPPPGFSPRPRSSRCLPPRPAARAPAPSHPPTRPPTHPPGTRCTVVGIYSTFKGKVERGSSALQQPYLRVVGIREQSGDSHSKDQFT